MPTYGLERTYDASLQNQIERPTERSHSDLSPVVDRATSIHLLAQGWHIGPQRVVQVQGLDRVIELQLLRHTPGRAVLREPSGKPRLRQRLHLWAATSVMVQNLEEDTSPAGGRC